MKTRVGEYQLQSTLGEGAMGTVYLALAADGSPVALKVLSIELDISTDSLRRFEQESDILTRLDHPNIVRAMGPLERDDEDTFYAMEVVEGRDMDRLLKDGPLDPKRALALTSQVLDGLAAAHSAGILHRDIKTSNLLVDDQDQVKVCDFGLAVAVDLTRLTLTGQILGSPGYMAPEQACGEEIVEQTDIYAMGCVLYEMLSGQLPFVSKVPMEVLRMHLEVAPKPPSALRPKLPEECDRLVLRALAKNPKDRFPSASAMRADVEALKTAIEEGRGKRGWFW